MSTCCGDFEFLFFVVTLILMMIIQTDLTGDFFFNKSYEVAISYELCVGTNCMIIGKNRMKLMCL